MRALPFDRLIWKRLQPKYSLSFSILPLGCALLFGLMPVYFLGKALGTAFGIAPDVPLNDQTNGWLWGTAFLTVMVSLVVVGYLIGFFLNALIMHWAFGWSWSKVRDVFLFSQLPGHWLNDELTRPASKENSKVTLVLVVSVIGAFCFMFWVYQPDNIRFAGIGGSSLLLMLFAALNFIGFNSEPSGKKVLLRAYLVSFSVLTVCEVIVFYVGGTIPRLMLVLFFLVPSAIYLFPEFRHVK